MRQSQQFERQSWINIEAEESVATAVVTAISQLKTLRKEAEAATEREADLFALPRCNGRANYSSSDAYAGAYLYAVHGTGVECPMHGKPQPGGRIRKGVGSSREAQQPVIEAMANYAAWQEAQAATWSATGEYTQLKMRVLELGLPGKRSRW